MISLVMNCRYTSLRLPERGEGGFSFDDSHEHARLAFEPRYALGTLGDCQWQELDCYFTSQFRVDGTIDLAHSSAAELREDLVRTELVSGLQRHGRVQDRTCRADLQVRQL